MKNNKKNILYIGLLLIISLSIISCSNVKTSKKPQNIEKQSLRIGCLSSTEPPVKFIQEVLELEGYNVDIVMFDANQLPAEALASGDIDGFIANSKRWINTYNEKNNTNLVMPEPYYYSYHGIYSTKWKSIDEIPQNAQIMIPSDPSNTEESLITLQSAKLITLADVKADGTFYSLIDIIENPKNIKILGGEITTTIRSIQDLDAVISPAVLAKDSKKVDPKSYLIKQKKDRLSPMGIVVKKEHENDKWLKNAMKKLKTKEYDDKFNQVFKGAFILSSEIDNK